MTATVQNGIADEMVLLKKAHDKAEGEHKDLTMSISALKSELAKLEGIKDRARKALGV